MPLTETGLQLELTSSLRAAFHRYTFAQGDRVWVLVDLQHGLTFMPDRQPVLANDTMPKPYGLEGTQKRRNWTTRTIAFSVTFDHPVAERMILAKRPGDAAPRFLLGFDLGGGWVLLAKVRLSQSSIYDKYGYYPFDKVEGEAVSRTREAGVGDDAEARSLDPHLFLA